MDTVDKLVVGALAVLGVTVLAMILHTLIIAGRRVAAEHQARIVDCIERTDDATWCLENVK